MNEISYDQFISIITNSKPDDWIIGDSELTPTDLTVYLIQEALGRIVPIEKLEKISQWSNTESLRHVIFIHKNNLSISIELHEDYISPEKFEYILFIKYNISIIKKWNISFGILNGLISPTQLVQILEFIKNQKFK